MTRTARTSSIIPCLRYRDAPAAIEWLCTAFGFERHLVVPGEDNTIAHAQLALADSMIMLGSAPHEGEYGKLVGQPEEFGGLNTQTIYVVVADADAHHARASAAGAQVIIPLTNQDYGGRDYTVKDCEGHVWTFGTYDPWRVPE
jgi:uncharacterized glyoxalase superfamily protein PhnB